MMIAMYDSIIISITKGWSSCTFWFGLGLLSCLLTCLSPYEKTNEVIRLLLILLLCFILLLLALLHIFQFFLLLPLCLFTCSCLVALV